MGYRVNYIGGMSNVTEFLLRIDAADADDRSELLELVYDELKELASARMMRERADHTLQATALVHEAYFRLLGATDRLPSWDNRRHFFPRRSGSDASDSRGIGAGQKKPKTWR